MHLSAILTNVTKTTETIIEVNLTVLLLLFYVKWNGSFQKHRHRYDWLAFGTSYDATLICRPVGEQYGCEKLSLAPSRDFSLRYNYDVFYRFLFVFVVLNAFFL